MTADGPADRVPLDALLVHREWVRALARRLVLDENDADDVEQETWRMAVERPPRHAESLRAWLATVVRHAAQGAGRRRTRRLRHEAAAFSRGEVGPDDLVAAAELQTRLARAVLELDEPYRSTVLYRYFEGLEATEIATRLGVPVETVRTRLKRAVERLRERMEGDLGDDRDAWCLLLFGVRADGVGAPTTAATGAAVAGGAAMAAGKKAVVVAAVVLVAAGLAWRFGLRSGEAPELRPTSRPGDETASATAAGDAKKPDSRRRAGADEKTAAAAKPGAGELEVVVLAGGAPTAGAVVETYAVPPDVGVGRRPPDDGTRAPSPISSTRTGAAGTARLALGAKDAFVVVARKPGFAAAAVEISPHDLDAGGTFTLRLAPGFALRGRALDRAGRGVAGASVVARPSREYDRSGPALAARATADETGAFALADIPSGASRLWAARPGGVAACKALVDVPNVAAIDLVLDADATLVGVVTDENGAPVAGASVAVLRDDLAGRSGAVATTDAAGTWRVAGLPFDWVRVEATKSGFLSATPRADDGRVRLADGRTTACDLTLVRGTPLSGKVLGPDGPVAGATITAARRTDVSYERPQTRSADDGSYRFDALAAGEVALVVSVEGLYQPGFDAEFGQCVRAGRAPREATVVVPETGEARLDLRLVRGLTVAGRVLDPDGAAVAGAEVSLRYDVSCESDGTYTWQRATSGDDGTFRFAGVAPADAALLSAWKQDVGFALGARVALDPSSGAEGATLQLARGGTLVVSVKTIEGVAAADVLVEAIDEVELDDVELAESPDRWRLAASLPLDADGTVTKPVPMGGGALVRAVAPGRAASKPTRVELDPTRARTSVVLTLEPLSSIDGVVTTTDRAPIAGAWISLARPDPRRRERVVASFAGEIAPRTEVADVVAVTDALGRFRVPARADRDWELTAAARGFTSTTTSLASSATAPVRLELAPALAIRGHVRFADGRPAAGVRVTIHADDDGTPTQTRADDAGAFAFEGRRDVAHSLLLEPTPAGASVRPLSADVRPRAEPYEFVVEAAPAVAGRVVDEAGRPVASCTLQLFRVGTGPMIERFVGNHATAASDDDGRFQMAGIEEGRYVMLVMPDRRDAWRGFAPQRIDGVAGGTTGMAVVLKPGLAIAGRVVDADGRAVTGVTVGLEAVPSDGADPDADVVWLGRLWAPVSADGAFRVEHLPPGRWRVVLLVENAGSPAALQPDDDVVRAGDVEVKLVASGKTTLAGVVVDADGGPIAANVSIAAEGGGAWRSLQTDGSGAFLFTGLGRSRTWRVVATPNDGETAPGVETAASGASGVRLVCRAGLVASGRVVAADGTPLARARLRLRRDGLPDARTLWTSPDGRFAAGGLVAGEYRVEADVAPREGRERDWRAAGTLSAGAADVELRVGR